MKMDEDIDEIFFQGLEGKSIEKPHHFWNKMSDKVLQKSIAKPWWMSTTAYVSGSIVMVVTFSVALIVNINTENTNQDMIPETSSKIAVDSANTIEDTTLNLQKDTTDAVSSSSKPVVLESNKKKKSADTQQRQTENKTNVLENILHSTKSNLTSDKVEQNVEKTIKKDSTQLIVNIPSDTLKPELELRDSVVKKKTPVVVIVQDTIVVVDTIKKDKE